MIKVKKPKAIVLDICDIAVKTGFNEKKIMPYFRSHVKSFLEENWAKPETQEDIDCIRNEPLVDGAPKIPAKSAEKAEVISAVLSYVNFQEGKKLEPKGYCALKRHVIFSGYDKGLLETLVFSDVALQIQKWRCDMQIRLFAVSKGCTEATKRFLTATNHGDLNLLIESHFGADMGPLTEKGTFEKILASIKQPPEDVLFLTKFLDEYVTAKSANMVAVQLVCRRQAEEVKDTNVPVIRVRSLNELQFE
ncbi:Enolase-phosphatase E1 [Tyrophagus putrescentiae]|nr:Enolase-phosphatase E1 [Tyrophagus putrescentiae]